MRIILTTLLLLAGLAIGQTFYESVAPTLLGTADGINYYTVISGEGGSTPSYWTDPNAGALAVYFSGDTNTVSTIQDWSGNDNHGTLIGPTVVIVGTNALGRIQYGLDFDGTDDSVTFLTTAQMHMTNDFTLSLWAVHDSASEYETWLARIYTGVDYSPKMDWTASAANLRLYYWKTAVAFDAITGPARTALSGWTHHTITHTSTTNIWYTNGVFCAGAASTGHPVQGQTTDFRLGRPTASSSSAYDGKMTEIRVYNSVLSASDAATLCEKSNPTNNTVLRE